MKDHPAIKTLIKVFTSPRLAVVVLSLSMVVVFLGSVAQQPMGLKMAVERYFKCWFIDTVAMGAAIESCVHLFGEMESKEIAAGELREKGMICFPGGYLLGTTLLMNMLCAYYSRFKITWKKGGVLLIHLGVITLMLGQFITDKIQVESYVALTPGERRNYTESFDHTELAILTRQKDGSEKVVSIPEHLLEKGGEIKHEALDHLQLNVRGYWVNADAAVTLMDFLRNYVDQERQRVDHAQSFLEHISRQMPAGKSAADLELTPSEWEIRLQEYAGIDSSFTESFRGYYKQYEAIKIQVEKDDGTQEQVAGYVRTKPPTYAEDERNIPVVWIQYIEQQETRSTQVDDANATQNETSDKSDSPQTRHLLVVLSNKEFPLSEGESAPRAVFRPKRLYHGYTMTLLDLKWEEYPGTDIPRNFESILLIDAPGIEKRQSNIYMNNPLRMEGETYYQFQMNSSEFRSEMLETKFQVIQNPNWMTAYIGCLVVALGMLWQFLGHLVGFIRKRKKA